MKFWIHYCTYNEYGTIYEGIVVSDVLESQETSFGTALEEVDFVLWFKRKDPSDLSGVEKSLWNTHQNYHKNSCAKLPYLKFERSKKRLDIATIATFGVSQDLPRKPRNGKQSYRKEWTEAILDQLILEVEVCRKKFKPSDDFQFDAFLEWLKSSRSIIPKNKRIAEKLRVESQKRFEIARSKMSDWEKLGIYWDDFHPKSKEYIPYPELWCCVDNGSPNGNDTGAEVLEIVKEKEFIIPEFLDLQKQSDKDLLVNIGLAKVIPPDDSIEYTVYRESVLGLAFAGLKINGNCPDWLLDLSISEIQKYCIYLETNHLDWQYRDAALKTQALMEKCLSDFKTSKASTKLKKNSDPKPYTPPIAYKNEAKHDIEVAEQPLGFWKKLFKLLGS